MDIERPAIKKEVLVFPIVLENGPYAGLKVNLRVEPGEPPTPAEKYIVETYTARHFYTAAYEDPQPGDEVKHRRGNNDGRGIYVYQRCELRPKF